MMVVNVQNNGRNWLHIRSWFWTEQLAGHFSVCCAFRGSAPEELWFLNKLSVSRTQNQLRNLLIIDQKQYQFTVCSLWC